MAVAKHPFSISALSTSADDHGKGNVSCKPMQATGAPDFFSRPWKRHEAGSSSANIRPGAGFIPSDKRPWLMHVWRTRNQPEAQQTWTTQRPVAMFGCALGWVWEHLRLEAARARPKNDGTLHGFVHASARFVGMPPSFLCFSFANR